MIFNFFKINSENWLNQEVVDQARQVLERFPNAILKLHCTWKGVKPIVPDYFETILWDSEECIFDIMAKHKGFYSFVELPFNKEALDRLTGLPTQQDHCIIQANKVVGVIVNNDGNIRRADRYSDLWPDDLDLHGLFKLFFFKSVINLHEQSRKPVG